MGAYDLVEHAALLKTKDTLDVIEELRSNIRSLAFGSESKELLRAPKDVGRGSRADIVVVTALADPEGRQLREAFADAVGGWIQEFIDGVPYYTGQGTFGTAKLTIAVASQSRMGMVDAALLSAKAIREWQPVYLVMTGLCAGIQGRVNLGDIVIADEVFDYGSGKIINKRLHPEFHFVPMHTALRAFLTDFAGKTEVLQGVRSKWKTKGGCPDTVLRAHIGPMGSGAAVVASKSTVQGIVEHKGKLLGVDMEAYGVAQAASHMLDGRTRFIICKSVSDFADKDKGDDYQDYCALVSAYFMREFFSRYEKHLFGLG